MPALYRHHSTFPDCRRFSYHPAQGRDLVCEFSHTGCSRPAEAPHPKAALEPREPPERGPRAANRSSAHVLPSASSYQDGCKSIRFVAGPVAANRDPGLLPIIGSAW